MAGKRSRLGVRRIGTGGGGSSGLGGRRGFGLSRGLRMLGGGGGGIHVFPRIKFVTFDRTIIKTNWDKINRTPLQRAGNMVRMIARGSIKRVKNRNTPPSIPGKPPKSRWQGTSPPFKQIYSVPTTTGGQVVGMVGFNSNPFGEFPVPGLHEHGGGATRYVKNPRRRKQPRGSKGRFKAYQTPARVRKRVRYPERPFMWPALTKARSKLPHLWASSVRRG